MSTTAAPYGLIPTVELGAGYNTQGFSTYEISSTYATVIRFGDLVELAADGYLERADVTNDATTNPVIGVFLGCEYTQANTKYRLNDQSFPGNSAIDVTDGLPVEARVADNPDAVFKIQASGQVAQASLGANAAVVNTATGNFGKSKVALNAAVVGATAALPLRIVGFPANPESTVNDAFTDCLVKINVHQLLTTTGV